MLKEASSKIAALSEILKKATKMEPKEEEMEKDDAKETPERFEDDMLSSEAEKDPSEMAECCPKCGQPMPTHPKHKAMIMIIAKGKKAKQSEDPEGSENN